MAQPCAKSLTHLPHPSRQLSQICKNPYHRSFSTTLLRSAGEANGSSNNENRTYNSSQPRSRPPPRDSTRLDARALLNKYGFRGSSQQRRAPSQPGRSDSPEDNPYAMHGKLAEMMQTAESSLSSQWSATALDKHHHLHVYSHRHNTHVTLTRPDHTPLLSLSAGNIGFKHAQRGSYDAAYQLATYSISKMVEKGMVHDMRGLELIMRGFGAGREAFQKALLSQEGRRLKPLVVRVTDATRLKFGGTRSKNVRRL